MSNLPSDAAWEAVDKRAKELRAYAAARPGRPPAIYTVFELLEIFAAVDRARALSAQQYQQEIAAKDALIERFTSGTLLGQYGRMQADRIHELEADRAALRDQVARLETAVVSARGVVNALDAYDAECQRVFGALPLHSGRGGAHLMAVIRRIEELKAALLGVD